MVYIVWIFLDGKNGLIFGVKIEVDSSIIFCMLMYIIYIICFCLWCRNCGIFFLWFDYVILFNFKEDFCEEVIVENLYRIEEEIER